MTFCDIRNNCLTMNPLNPCCTLNQFTLHDSSQFKSIEVVTDNLT